MADYTLFCSPDTYAMSAHAVLEETGAEYNLHWVEIFTETPDPQFLAASPHCRTPALSGPDGTVFETGAVCLYIAENFPEAGLVIQPGDPRRGVFLQWFHYLASTLQPDVIIQFHPEFYMPDEGRQSLLKKTSMARLRKVYATLEAALSKDIYLFGDDPTVPDFILGMQTVWQDTLFPQGLDEFPRLKRHLTALSQRPAVQRVLKVHQTELQRQQSNLKEMSSLANMVQVFSGFLKRDQVLSSNRLSARNPGYCAESLDAELMLRPGNVGELVEICKTARENGIALVPHGGLTGLVDGTASQQGQAIVSFERMNRILRIDPGQGIVVVEPGVTLESLETALEPHGLICGVDIPSRSSCTIGGMASTNAGGTRVLRYGMMRQNILGLEVVLADGRVLDMTSP